MDISTTTPCVPYTAVIFSLHSPYLSPSHRTISYYTFSAPFLSLPTVGRSPFLPSCLDLFYTPATTTCHYLLLPDSGTFCHHHTCLPAISCPHPYKLLHTALPVHYHHTFAPGPTCLHTVHSCGDTHYFDSCHHLVHMPT